MSVTVLDDRYRVARKEHQCEWCYQSIQKGARHHVQSNVGDGVAYSFRTHTRCHAQFLAAWAVCQDWQDEDRSTEDLREIAREEAREIGWGKYLKLCRSKMPTALRRKENQG